MAAWRRALELSVGDEDTAKLRSIAQSRTEPASRVERARILLAYRKDPHQEEVKPHKVRYDLEQRDPDFAEKRPKWCASSSTRLRLSQERPAPHPCRIHQEL